MKKHNKPLSIITKISIVFSSIAILTTSALLAYFTINNTSNNTLDGRSQKTLPLINNFDWINNPKQSSLLDYDLTEQYYTYSIVFKNSVTIANYAKINTSNNYDEYNYTDANKNKDYEDGKEGCVMYCDNDKYFYQVIKINDNTNLDLIAGSGTVFYDSVKNKYYILTCRHLFFDLAEEKGLTDDEKVAEAVKKVNESRDIYCLKYIKENDNSETNLKLKLNLLKVGKGDYDLALLEFHVENDLDVINNLFSKDLKIGSDRDYLTSDRVIHIGSYFFELHHSYSYGFVAYKYRKVEISDFFDAEVYNSDQLNITSFPGSSGGGVFLADKPLLIGVLFAGNGRNVSFIIPARMILKFLN